MKTRISDGGAGHIPTRAKSSLRNFHKWFPASYLNLLKRPRIQADFSQHPPETNLLVGFSMGYYQRLCMYV